jgi:hypothetical protein
MRGGLKPLAYGKALLEKRQAGQRVGLLVISVHDWEAGKWFEDRTEVARLVLPADVPVDAADWSICLALDCIVTGAVVDGIFFEACAALKRCGAASVWGDFSEGICLLEPVGQRMVAVEGPYPLYRMGAVLRQHRETMMMLKLGLYGSRVFNAARLALIDNVAGLADMLKAGQRGAA